MVRVPLDVVDARVAPLGDARRVLHFGLGQPPDAREARELAGARVAEELLALDVGALGRLVGAVAARAIRQAHMVDVRGLLLLFLDAARRLLHLPGADARGLPGVLR